MLTSRRKQLILEQIRLHGMVQVLPLSDEWQVSPDTIRRDLRDLAKDGLVQRVHGGALPASPAVADYPHRERISNDAKGRIGMAAAALVHDGQVVAIDGGTTTLQLIRNLPISLSATVVTHSPIIASALGDHSSVEVILIGGRLFKHSMVTTGAATIAAIQAIHTDVFFLGATGVHPDAGVTTADWEEAGIKRAFCENAAEVVLLATPEKLNAASAFRIIPTSELDVLFVDREASDELLDPYRSLGITVAKAE